MTGGVVELLFYFILFFNYDCGSRTHIWLKDSDFCSLFKPFFNLVPLLIFVFNLWYLVCLLRTDLVIWLIFMLGIHTADT